MLKKVTEMFFKQSVILLVFALFVLCNGAGNNISDLKQYPKAKWTVAVYMNGDNDLETSITG